MRTLYQFPFSHYCEKARWALDYKGLAYECRNVLPGPHLKVTGRLAPKTCVPILIDQGAVLQDSTSIITYLDGMYPERPLTPNGPPEARSALEWEEFLDQEIGVPLRLWFYFHTLRDRRRALNFLLDGGPWYGRPLFAFIFPRVRTAMLEMMNINPASAKQAEHKFQAALDRLDMALQERPFLAGDRFSRADLTACALLSPYYAPGESDSAFAAAHPAPVCALRAADKRRRSFGWALDVYRAYRQPLARGA
jgi:glutathione S-transferase